jgi:hypothetical protein
MKLRFLFAENMRDPQSAQDTEIRQQKPMTAPGNRFRADEAGPAGTDAAEKRVKLPPEFLSLHIISISPESLIGKPAVRRVVARFAEPA